GAAVPCAQAKPISVTAARQKVADLTKCFAQAVGMESPERAPMAELRHGTTTRRLEHRSGNSPRARARESLRADTNKMLGVGESMRPPTPSAPAHFNSYGWKRSRSRNLADNSDQVRHPELFLLPPASGPVWLRPV